MFENIRQRWDNAGSGSRAGLIGGILAIALLFIWLVYWTNRDTYQVLFSDLDPQDATTIVSELEKMKVPYRLEDGGKAVLVDQESVYKTRLKLMGKGVNLRGTVGFEIFNTTDFGTTEFAQKINYQRAMQGELARTIMGFEEIKFARVHLVMPESGLFKKNNVKPKASISLIMKGDSQLTSEQVVGIQRLVAASVPEIDADSVTVLDQRGIALTRTADTEGRTENAGGRLETKMQIETYLTKKIVDMLDKAVGTGQAIVSVDATLTQDHVKVTREDVIPLSNRSGENAGSVVRRRQSQQNSVPIGDGDALAKSQLGEGAAKKGTSGNSGSGILEIEYQNGRKIEQSVSTPGNIKRISVGVLLPNTISADRLDKIRDVVAMAAGINQERGDSIAIYSIEQFAAKAHQATTPGLGANAPLVPEPILDAAQQPSGVISQLVGILIGVLLLTVGFLVYRGRQAASNLPRRLSVAERSEALVRMREWLKNEDASDIIMELKHERRVP